MRPHAARRALPWWTAGLLSCATVGCSKRPTALVLALGAEPGARSAIDSVRIEVSRRGEPRFAHDYPLEPSGRPLPGTLTLSDDGGGAPDDPVRIEFVGTRAGVERVRRRAVVGLAEARVMLLRLALQDECVGVTCADVDSTCDRGACVSAIVDPATLPDFSTHDDALATLDGAAGRGGASGAAGRGGASGAAGKGGASGAAGKGGASGAAGKGGDAGGGGSGGASGAAGKGGDAGGGGSGGASGGAGAPTSPTGLEHCWDASALGQDVVGDNHATVHPDVTISTDASGSWFRCGATAGPGTGVDASQPPKLPSLGPWSIDLWVQRASAVGDVWVLDRSGAALSLASLYVDASSKWGFAVRFSDQPAAPTSLAAGVVPMATWTHLALTYDGAKFVTYNQGQAVTSMSKLSVPGATAASSFAFDPPRWCGHPTGGNGFGGGIRALRMWSRALTSAEVASVAAGTVGPRFGCASQ